jgi:hypothetical protein
LNAHQEGKQQIVSAMTTSAAESPSSTASGGSLWDVQEILAYRTSITGENELLVVWKTSWIPVSSMVADGPVLRRFTESTKCRFVAQQNQDMHVLLPVEPGTTMQIDCAAMAAQLERRTAATAQASNDGTPRKALNSDAKKRPRRPDSAGSQQQQQQ